MGRIPLALGFPALAALLAGCGGGVPIAPIEPPPPRMTVEAPDLDDAGYAVAPPNLSTRSAPPDPILASPAATHATLTRGVDWWIRYWSDGDSWSFPVYLERMGAFEGIVDEALERHGLPRSLRYLPIIESGYSPRAVSRVSAVGLWQFMAPTARAFDMEVGAILDERRDPVKSTDAAARYLKELRERFGSWFLALAAYNGGPSRVERLLRQMAPGAPLSDDLFFVIRGGLPRETRDFLPKFIAAAHMAENAADYGVVPTRPMPPLAYDEVTLPDATTLDVVAEAAGVSEAQVQALNPQILRRVTPRGRATTVRLPAGTGFQFRLAYDRVPPDRRVTLTEHVIQPGETLWEIARRYGIGLDQLQGANPTVDPRRLRPGRELLVPLAPGVTVTAARSLGGDGAATSSERPGRPAGGVHVVERGDTLWDVARHYGVRVDDLRRWNGLGQADLILPGQRLRIGGG
ncbi:MAG TPA: LysM peptidoglycan-binding domain-containing protein [Longimicrobiales bacterium]|jgi:membrane-bound lytic murein transglycosylase D